MTHPNKLTEAARLYRSAPRYDRSYASYREERDDASWWSAAGPTETEVVRLFRFLNEWASRLRASAVDVERFHAIAPDVSRLLRSVRAKTIVDVDLVESQVALEAAYRTVESALWKKNATAISKILHWYNPRLFIMWDRQIREALGLRPDAQDYVGKFLPAMQSEARDCIRQASAVGQSLTNLENTWGKPIAKVLDEFNYGRFTAKFNELEPRDGEPRTNARRRESQAEAFHTTIEVAASAEGRYERFDALVNAGASYTLLPGSTLARLGVTPTDAQAFALADGRHIERRVGEATIRIEGRLRTNVVVFADEGAQPLLGALTLESFGLGIDPLGKKLIRVERYLMSADAVTTP